MSGRTLVLNDRDLVVTCVGTREALHAAVRRLYEHAKERVSGAPDKVDRETGELEPRVWRFVFGESEDDRTLMQNAFYWAAVLRQISEQAAPCGQRWTADAWHELFKRQFLGYEVIKVKVAGRKKLQVYRRLRSTTGLSVKQMSEYLDQVIAFATTDLGVAFVFDRQEREAVRWHRPARKQTRQAAEAAA